MTRQRITLVTKDDLDIDTFRVSGAGGQHRDKTSNGVRIRHRASGAVGECGESRSQAENRKVAFRRMTETPIFKVWLDLELHPETMRIEIRKDGEWTVIPGRLPR